MRKPRNGGEELHDTIIRFEEVSWRRGDRLILDRVSFRVQPGEHWVVLGRNGSGKTTLLEMVNGYLFPTAGRITVLGEMYGRCDVREMRRRIGYMSQSLLEKLSLKDPVWEAVATGMYAYLRFYQEIPAEAIRRAVELLDRFGIGHLAHAPLGTLSQGERKKALLARAMMPEPDILILDEPCSGLDLMERERLLADLDGLTRDRTLLYVTHHVEEIMPLFTHVLVLNEGKVVAAGPKERVLTGELLERVFAVPVDVDWSYGRPWIKVRGGFGQA